MKKTAILFPGQGSQYVGMGQEFLEANGKAVELMDIAEEQSGFALKQLCLQGPMEELTRVACLQPAMTVINMICWQAVKEILPEPPSFICGHSLGEYSALCATKAISFEDTIRLVTRRGELMEREGDKNPGGMRAILGLTIEEVETELASQDRGTVTIANHNAEKQVIISGDAAGLDGLSSRCQERGGKVIPLKVSVANHSPLVAAAVPDFEKFMAGIRFNQPEISLLFNVTAEREDDPEAIRTIMARQIASRVRWYETARKMIDAGVELFIEVGPKPVLTGIMKKNIPRRSGIQCLQVDTPDAAEKLKEQLV